MHVAGAVAAYRVDQAATFRGKRAVDELAQLPIVVDAHMLEHPDRDERIVAAGDIAVVVEHVLDAAREPLRLRALASETHLLLGNVEGTHFCHAVTPSHVQGEPAPAAARLDHRIARSQAQLAADVIQLGRLSLPRGSRLDVGK